MSLEYTTSNPEDGVLVLKIFGSVDENTFANLEMALLTGLDRSAGRLAVDLSGITTFHEYAAGMLVAAQGEAKEHAGNLVVVNPSQSVRSALEKAGNPLPVVASREDAVRALRHP